MCVCVKHTLRIFLHFITYNNKITHIHTHTYTHTHTPHTHHTNTPHMHTHTHIHAHTHTHTCTHKHTQSHISSIENCVDINSTQFDTNLCLFKLIRHHGLKKIPLVSNSTQKASNCVFRVVYGKFIPI